MSALRICYIPPRLLDRAKKHGPQWRHGLVDIMRRESADHEGVAVLLSRGGELRTLAERTEWVLREFEATVQESMVSVWPERRHVGLFQPVSVASTRRLTHSATCFWEFYVAKVCGMRFHLLPAKGEPFRWSDLPEWFRVFYRDSIVYDHATRGLEEPFPLCGAECREPEANLTVEQQHALSALGNLATGLWLSHFLGCDAEKSVFRDWWQLLFGRMQPFWLNGVDEQCVLPPPYSGWLCDTTVPGYR